MSLQLLHHSMLNLFLRAVGVGDLLNSLAAKITGHHDDRIFKVNRAAMIVGQAAIIEDL